MTDPCCQHEAPKPAKPWYRKREAWAVFISAALVGASYRLPWLGAFRESFFHYLNLMFWPIMIGFSLGGVIDHFVPKEYVSKYLARKTWKTVFYATGFGFLMSACSHGILALAAELHKKGASGAAVVSFLLASPWANLPITILLFGFFGWKALLIVLAALLVAIVTGLLFHGLDHLHWIERNVHTVKIPAGFSIRKDIRRRLREYRPSAARLRADAGAIFRGAVNLFDMVFWWVWIGIMVASLAGAYVPGHFFDQYMGPTVMGLVITLAVATVIEVCSEGSSPIAFEIYRQTGAFGNAFVFLMAGVVTDFTEILIIWKAVGRRTALWMVALTVPQVIAIGFVFNALLSNI